MCAEDGSEVPFGQDSYYEQIIQKDFRGFDFVGQRDSWKEGTDLSFIVEFYSKCEKGAAVQNEEASNSSSQGVIDAEIVDIKA